MSSVLFGLTMKLYWEFGSWISSLNYAKKGIVFLMTEILLCAQNIGGRDFPTYKLELLCHIIVDDLDHNTIIYIRGMYHGMEIVYSNPIIEVRLCNPRDPETNPTDKTTLSSLEVTTISEDGNLWWESNI